MNWRGLITVDPAVCHGKACFSGTWVMVSVILDNLAAGNSADRILESYPSLKPDHVTAALVCAAEFARNRVVDLPPPKVA